MESGSTTQTLPHCDAVDEAVKEIMMMACGTVAEPCEDMGSAILVDGVIIAVISVVGDVDWSIFIGLPRETAEQLAKAFCGFDIPFDAEDMGDAIGEVTNILAGSVKQILDKRGVTVDISLPSVMRAQGLEVLISRDSSASKHCFNSQVGYFWTGVVAGKSPGLIT